MEAVQNLTLPLEDRRLIHHLFRQARFGEDYATYASKIDASSPDPGDGQGHPRTIQTKQNSLSEAELKLAAKALDDDADEG